MQKNILRTEITFRINIQMLYGWIIPANISQAYFNSGMNSIAIERLLK